MKISKFFKSATVLSWRCPWCGRRQQADREEAHCPNRVRVDVATVTARPPTEGRRRS